MTYFRCECRRSLSCDTSPPSCYVCPVCKTQLSPSPEYRKITAAPLNHQFDAEGGKCIHCHRTAVEIAAAPLLYGTWMEALTKDADCLGSYYTPTR